MFLTPDYYTDDAVMYTEELLNTLCVNHVILVTGESMNMWVGQYEDDRDGLVNYLSSLDSITTMDRADVEKDCPEDILIADGL